MPNNALSRSSRLAVVENMLRATRQVPSRLRNCLYFRCRAPSNAAWSLGEVLNEVACGYFRVRAQSMTALWEQNYSEIALLK